MKKVASLQYEVIFKKAFGDPAIFTAFARAMLGVELEIDHVETEKKFDLAVGPVQTKFDLFAEDKKNRIIVEIQHERRVDHYDRFLHYHCAALLVKQSVQSQNYRPALQVFTIVVLTSGDKHRRDVAISDFDPRDLQGQPLGEFKHKILFLCPKYANADTPEQYREWLLAIDDSLDGEVEETNYHQPEILRVFDHILTDDITPEDRALMKDEYSDELLKQEKFEQGVQQGLQQGVQQGLLLAQIETARRMLESGLDIADIASFTGLSEERITALRDESEAA